VRCMSSGRPMQGFNDGLCDKTAFHQKWRSGRAVRSARTSGAGAEASVAWVPRYLSSAAEDAGLALFFLAPGALASSSARIRRFPLR